MPNPLLEITTEKLEPKVGERELERLKLAPPRRLERRLCKDGKIRTFRVGRNLNDLTVSFWRKVQRGDVDLCWPWLGGVVSKEQRYGKFGVGKSGIKAHRFSYYLANGRLPDNLCVLHECDNPICVNPNHLFLGTVKDNSDDMDAKGRRRPERGEHRYSAKLKDSDIRAIRAKYIKRVYGIDRLAAEFNVSRSAIYFVIKNKHWTHVQ